MLQVQELYEQHQKALFLESFVNEQGGNNPIAHPEIDVPGLSLTGYLKNYRSNKILIFGPLQLDYLKEIPLKDKTTILHKIITQKTPAVFITGNKKVPRVITEICKKYNVALLRSQLETMSFIGKLLFILHEEFSPLVTVHGTLVEVHGVGVLLQGESSVGKSEAALGLLERRHRLISDDVVKVRKKEGGYLVGSGPKLTRHLMEIRGIGLINVAHLFGAVSVRREKTVDIVVQLEKWNQQTFYDRVGIEEKYKNILNIPIPYHLVPVKLGRDVILMIETIALNHRLKGMGYNSAQEFNAKLLQEISQKKKEEDARNCD